MPELFDDDEIVFADENTDEKNLESNEKWKIIISDDENEVHNVTKMVLANVIYKGKELEFLHAYSGEDTIRILKANPDAALLLLDVVMEEDDTGLKIIRHIREILNNSLIRIVIRTGQPGEAPEKNVIVDYDINDYKEKTELTSNKLFSTVIASLRSYDNLIALNNNKKGIELILTSSNLIFRLNSVSTLFNEMLEQIKKLFTFRLNARKSEIKGFIASPLGKNYTMLSAIGGYETNPPGNVKVLLSGYLNNVRVNTFHYDKNICIGKFISFTGDQFFIYIIKDMKITVEERNLLNIFCTNIISTYNKLCLTNEVENTQREILYTLGEVVETRSNETGNHVKRVAEYSYLLGLKYGLDEEEAGILKQASPMHDVGKVGIDDDILNKPSPLTREEFNIIKKHTIIGYDIFKNSNRRLLKAAAVIALQHHERYDGQGYPQALTSKNIHIFGKITCLADIFDALGSKRPYKLPWELDQILDYIKVQKAKIFEPDLVDIFFANLEEILSIRKTLID